MPAPGPFTLNNQIMLPALYLYPLNDSFIPKHIALAGGQRVKIGRQTNAKTQPGERNGYFDSKVLSRQHAEVWEEAGKIFIKDVRSSNGTFINGERLSAEGLESDPFELKTDDIVEFGIDIVGEDNKTIVHHKVAARVVCVFTDADAAAAARAEAHQSMGPVNGLNGQNPGPSGAGAFNFANMTGPGTQRRPPIQQPQGLGGMGGMGGMRQPGKSGLTFDHIISRLQGEVQKSRETGAELHSLTGAMNDIHDTLGGALPPSLPPFPQSLPPVRQQHPQDAASEAGSSGSVVSTQALSELQEQLRETQSSLAGHVDKIRALETVMAEHDAIKREVSSLRETIEERRRAGGTTSPIQRELERQQQQDEHERSRASEFEHDDDDARSVATLVPHELERVEEEDEEAAAAQEYAGASVEHRRRHEEFGRPRTPEPSGLGMDDDDHRGASFTNVPLDRPVSPSSQAAIPEELTKRFAVLTEQLETALALSRTLQEQHAAAQDTISALQDKVASLEGRVEATQTKVAEQAETVESLKMAVEAPSFRSQDEEQRESLTEMVNEWKKSVEGQWSSVQEAWDSERERLRRATEEWERRARDVESTVQDAVTRVDEGVSRIEVLAREQLARAHGFANGDVSKHGHGLVTPPSPRSLSADSTRSRPRRRHHHRASRSSSRGRNSSPGAASTDGGSSLPALDPSHETSSSSSEGAASVPASIATSFTDSPKRTRAPWLAFGRPVVVAADEDDELSPPRLAVEGGKKQYPLTPKASFDDEALQKVSSGAATHKHAATHLQPPDQHLAQYSSVVGMIVLSVAAAAVLYRVKPELSG